MAEPGERIEEAKESEESQTSSDRLKGDAVSTMAERVDLDKGSEVHTKVKKFTVGDNPDTGFGIDGLGQKAENAVKAILGPQPGDALADSFKFRADSKDAPADKPDGDSSSADVARAPSDGSFVYIIRTDKYEVTQNANQQATHIKRSDGTSTRIEYDEGDPPKPTKISESDGTEYRREGSRWNQYKNGRPTGESWKGDFAVGGDGAILKAPYDGLVVEIRHPDGSRTDCTRDRNDPKDHKPYVTKDAGGKVVEVNYFVGVPREGEFGTRSRSIEIDGKQYDVPDHRDNVNYRYKDGKLVEAETPDGRSWKKTAGGLWQQYDGDHPIGRPQAVELKVSSQGDLVITKAGEIVAIKHLDGSETETKWDGSRETRDKNGRVTEIVRSDGSYTEVKSDGSVITVAAKAR